MQTMETNGSSFHAHLAMPETGKGPGVLLLHAWWGLNQSFIQACDQLARAGFVTLAPDYYQGRVAETIEAADAARLELDHKATQKLVTQAVDYLAGLPAVTGNGIGVIGFSLGAGYAVEAARSRNKTVKAVVVFYGTGGGLLDKTSAAYLGHFADHDAWGADPARVKRFENRICAAGREASFYIYPDTEHWFVEADRPEYQPAAAALAWAETLICSVPSYAHSASIEQPTPHLLGIATPAIDGLVTLTSTVGFDCSASRRAFTPEQIGRAQTHV